MPESTGLFLKKEKLLQLYVRIIRLNKGSPWFRVLFFLDYLLFRVLILLKRKKRERGN